MIRKKLCCFFFAFLWVVGFMGGFYGGKWFYQGSAVGGRAEASITILTPQDGASSASVGEPARYPGEQWRKQMFLEYAAGTAVTLLLLLAFGEPRPLMVFWALYGFLAGMYGRGMGWYFGGAGLRYCLLGFVPPALFGGLLSGILWQYRRFFTEPGIWLEIQGASAGGGIGKRVRRLVETLRTRLVRTAALLSAILLCYLVDFEILKRIQWKLLLEMLGDRIN